MYNICLIKWLKLSKSIIYIIFNDSTSDIHFSDSVSTKWKADWVYFKKICFSTNQIVYNVLTSSNLNEYSEMHVLDKIFKYFFLDIWCTKIKIESLLKYDSWLQRMVSFVHTLTTQHILTFPVHLFSLTSGSWLQLPLKKAVFINFFYWLQIPVKRTSFLTPSSQLQGAIYMIFY